MDNPLKFLVVDDYFPIRKTLSDLLGAKKFNVVGVGTGREAIERVGRESFGVAIIDASLPDLDGRTVLRKIKELRPDIRCLMTTASLDMDPQAILREGASDLFTKPIDLERMMDVIGNMVGM